MTQVFNEHGRAVAVTVLQAGPCTVTQVREPKKHGYQAIQVGFEPANEARMSKPVLGQFKKHGGTPSRYLREFRLSNGETFSIGQQLTVELFKEGELVDVSGISIGKGFQGGMRRWNWKGGPATHGSMSHRAPGSIGSTTDPGRVFRGHHLPGHMGHARVTLQNLRVMKIDLEANLLLVQGAVPGPERQVVMVRRSIKRPGAITAAKGLQEVLVETEDEKKAKAKSKKK